MKKFLAIILIYALALPPFSAMAAGKAFVDPVAASFSAAVPINAQSVIQLQGSDGDGTALTYAIVANPGQGTLSNLNTTTGAVVYTPPAAFTGSTSFTYKVTSGGADSNTATVSLTITANKTRIIDTLSGYTNGKVTFILTEIAQNPSGITPAKSSVSATVNSSGQFDIQVYPSRALSPVQYYQVWFDDGLSRNSQLLGVYDIPAATSTITLAGRRVTNANLAAQYTFASKAEVDALTAAVAAATTAQLYPSLTNGKHIVWNGTTFANSLISESGGNVNVNGGLSATTLGGNGNAVTNLNPNNLGNGTLPSGVAVPGTNLTGTVADERLSTNVTKLGNTATGTSSIVRSNAPSLVGPNMSNPAMTGNATAVDITASGTVQAAHFVGNGAGLTGIGTGTGGFLNTGSTTAGADTDADGTGVIALQTRGITRLQVENDGTVNISGVLNAYVPSMAYAGLAVAPPNVMRVKLTDKNKGFWYYNLLSNTWVPENGGAYNVLDWGAKCDGSTDDSTVINAAIAAAVAAGGGQVNYPGGKTCRANMVVTEARGITLQSYGSRNTTIIQAVGANPALAINGMWYSRVEGFTLKADGYPGANVGVLEIDGNYDGTHTLRVQGNTFKDIFVDGGAPTSDIGITICRQGGSLGQCSEMKFDNVHVNNVLLDGWNQYGFNALANQVFGGNVQNYRRHGIKLYTGGMNVFGTGFQCTNKYTQVLNDGWDFDASTAGVGDRILLYGIRSESLRVVRSGFSQLIDVRGLTHNVDGAITAAWGATTAYALNAVTAKASPSGKILLYRVTTAGTSGSSEPTWPESGTVSDGSVVWTQTPLDVVNLPGGEFSERLNTISFSDAVKAKRPQYADVREFTGSGTLNLAQSDSSVLISATGSLQVNMPPPPSTPSHGGQTIFLRRYDATANAVTVVATETGTGNQSIDFPANSYLILQYNGGGALTARWWVVAKYNPATVTNTGGSLAANAVVLGAGTNDTKVVAGITTDGISKLTLGVAGTSVGSIDLNNGTSGRINVAPQTGALGTSNLILPARSATVATTTGSVITNNCAKWDASGNLVDSGGTCGGGGGGGSPAGSGSELQYRVDGSTFGAVSSSSVSGANITLGGNLSFANTGIVSFGTASTDVRIKKGAGNQSLNIEQGDGGGFGDIFFRNMEAVGSAYMGFTSRTTWKSPSDGILTFLNYAWTDFSRVQLGGTTTKFVGLTPVNDGTHAQGLIVQRADGTAQVFANLSGSATNGSMIYCSDCTHGGTVGATCAASGNGALAIRLNGAWKCY